MASAIVEDNLTPEGARAVYGHWLGPVSPNCVVTAFYMDPPMPFIRHGWILLPDESVIDPTRYVFEAFDPYIYKGPNDHYDEGGQKWRTAHLSPCPPPDPTLKTVRIELDRESWTHCRTLTGFDLMSDWNLNHIGWIANLPLNMLGMHAEAIFRALVDAGMGAFIPLDHRLKILGGS